MKIAEASQACGLSAYTIRYYEKSNMLPMIARDAGGNRRFTALAKEGDKGMPERRNILLDHAENLRARRMLLEKCEDVLATKIASYGALKPKGTQ